MRILTISPFIPILVCFALVRVDLKSQQSKGVQNMRNLDDYAPSIAQVAQAEINSKAGKNQLFSFIDSSKQLSINSTAHESLQYYANKHNKQNDGLRNSQKGLYYQNQPSDFERVSIVRKQPKRQSEINAIGKTVNVNEDTKSRKEQKQEDHVDIPIQNTLSASQQIKKQQNKSFNDQLTKIGEEKREFNEYVFDLDSKESEDFTIQTPIQQLIIFQVRVYANNNGAFSDPQNVQNEGPLQINVYEGDNHLIYQKSFFFKIYAVYKGLANNTYRIKFTNKGSHKLIFLKMLIIFERSHYEDLLHVQDIASHAERLDTVKGQISQKLQNMNMRFMLENENNKKLTEGLFKYYFYNIFEMVVIVLFCILQVQIVQRLLTRVSVV